MKTAAFKPTSSWIKKDMAAAKRAFNAKTFAEIRNGLEPGMNLTWVPIGVNKTTKAYRKEMANLYLYAAELGKKKGLLPDNCSGFTAGGSPPKDGKATVYFTNATNGRSAVVQLENLDWVPAPAIEETVFEPMKLAAWLRQSTRSCRRCGRGESRRSPRI